MKKIKTFAIIAFISFSALLSSCSNDDGDNNTSSGTNSFIKGKVDGTPFASMEIQGVSTAIATKTGSGDQTLIMIQGTNEAMNSMVITTMGIVEAGTYEFDAFDDGNVLAYVDNATSTSYATSNCDSAAGTLVITHLDGTKIEGTFSFRGNSDANCSNSKMVTEGSFRGVFMQ